MSGASKNKSGELVFEGSNFLRQRLTLATLTGQPIKIHNIRIKDSKVGLKESEANLIRLLDKLTNGSRIEVDETGTELVYRPGVLRGGRVEHTCSKHRGIGYYLEMLLVLAPFCKQRCNITLKGVTNNKIDPSVDQIKGGALPVMRKFLLNDDGLDIKIQRRGMPPDGGGEVLFTSPLAKSLRPLQLTECGKIKKIRGTAFALKVSPAMASRMVDAAKGVLLNFIPDVYIYTDTFKGENAGKSTGYGISLLSESNKGVYLTAEATSNPAGAEPSIPEDVGREAAYRLLEEIYRGGTVDSHCQGITTLCMALGPKDVSKCLTGPLSPYTIGYLRHLKSFIHIVFRIEDEKLSELDEDLHTGGSKVLLSCLGTGYTNVTKSTS